MSLSGFHAHFKAVTSMSPLQFQKLLRLQEARRLMVGENLEAAEADLRTDTQPTARGPGRGGVARRPVYIVDGSRTPLNVVVLTIV